MPVRTLSFDGVAGYSPAEGLAETGIRYACRSIWPKSFVMLGPSP